MQDYQSWTKKIRKRKYLLKSLLKLSLAFASQFALLGLSYQKEASQKNAKKRQKIWSQASSKVCENSSGLSSYRVSLP